MEINNSTLNPEGENFVFQSGVPMYVMMRLADSLREKLSVLNATGLEENLHITLGSINFNNYAGQQWQNHIQTKIWSWCTTILPNLWSQIENKEIQITGVRPIGGKDGLDKICFHVNSPSANAAQSSLFEYLTTQCDLNGSYQGTWGAQDSTWRVLYDSGDGFPVMAINLDFYSPEKYRPHISLFPAELKNKGPFELLSKAYQEKSLAASVRYDNNVFFSFGHQTEWYPLGGGKRRKFSKSRKKNVKVGTKRKMKSKFNTKRKLKRINKSNKKRKSKKK